MDTTQTWQRLHLHPASGSPVCDALPGPEVAGSRVELTVKARSRIRASAHAWWSRETGAVTCTT